MFLFYGLKEIKVNNLKRKKAPSFMKTILLFE